MAVLRTTTSSALTGSVATYYTVTALYSAFVRSILLCNTDTVARTVTGYMVPASGSAANTNIILPTVSIPAGTSVRFGLSSTLEASATIQLLASTANVVSARISALEFLNPSVIVANAPGLLQATSTTYYTANASKVGILHEVILANTDSVARTVTLYMDGTGVANTVLDEVSIAANTVLILPYNETIAASGTVRALASSANVVSIRVSTTEHS